MELKPWSRKRPPIPVFLLGKSHGQRSLAGYSPGGHKDSDTTERARAHTHTHTHTHTRTENILEVEVNHTITSFNCIIFFIKNTPVFSSR